MKANQARTTKVLVALTAAMTVGGFILMTLDNHGPARGAYSLASYLRLDPIDEVVMDSIRSRKTAWSGIEIYYSGTPQGNLPQMLGEGKTGFHFLVCNGKGAEDGQISCTPNWAAQKYIDQTDSTIRIYVVANRKTNPITGSQWKRTSALVDSLSRNFNIPAEKIRYPSDWQL